LKLIIGLGNPGPEYRDTKHNIGFWVLDRLASRHAVRWRRNGKAEVGEGNVAGKAVLLAKPQIFMNRSGEAVLDLMRENGLDVSDLVVVYDDLDLEIGRVRIRTRGGSGGHRGMESIIEALGDDRFVRVRLGIGRDERVDPAEYVLKPFHLVDHPQISTAVIRAAEGVERIIAGELSRAMNECNQHQDMK
jgi:PTH1 family peptidyl-tRNA hydrolase